MGRGWRGALGPAMVTENCSYHMHRLRNAKINSEKTPVLKHCSERWHILRGTQFTLALSASRSQQTDSLPYYVLIKAVMLVRLRITQLSEEVTSEVNVEYMNTFKKIQAATSSFCRVPYPHVQGGF